MCFSKSFRHSEKKIHAPTGLVVEHSEGENDRASLPNFHSVAGLGASLPENLHFKASRRLNPHHSRRHNGIITFSIRSSISTEWKYLDVFERDPRQGVSIRSIRHNFAFSSSTSFRSFSSQPIFATKKQHLLHIANFTFESELVIES
jgi:hypothetical protein